ncbi:MAG: TetR/AcrR family transcriptional regulator [Acidobacteriota bacterium]|jgi:AcrR family transcriptional regulator
MRDSIREAVTKLIEREGVQALTMDKVAEEAGVAKGTLYTYFETKKQLLDSVFHTALEPMKEELGNILDSPETPEARIRLFILRHMSYFDEHRRFFRVLLYERSVAQGHRERLTNNRYRSGLEKLASVLEEGMKKGFFRRCNPEKLATMIMEADIAMISQRLYQNDPPRALEDAEFIYDVFLYGISAAERPARGGHAYAS